MNTDVLSHNHLKCWDILFDWNPHGIFIFPSLESKDI